MFLEIAMDEIFEKLKKEGKNNVDSLIQWMKDAKIIDGVKVTQEKVREKFQGCDPKNVDIGKFKEVIEKVAVEHKQTATELSRSLVEEGAKMASAVKAGMSALKGAMPSIK